MFGTSRLEESNNPFDHCSRFSRLAFPHNQDLPAKPAKLSAISSISCLVARQLPLPELGPCGRLDLAVFASMAVPETSVDENHLPPAGENQVRASGEIVPMHPVPITQGVYQPPDDHLRVRVLAPNPGHAVLPLLRRENVHHVMRHATISHGPPKGCPGELLIAA